MWVCGCVYYIYMCLYMYIYRVCVYNMDVYMPIDSFYLAGVVDVVLALAGRLEVHAVVLSWFPIHACVGVIERWGSGRSYIKLEGSRAEPPSLFLINHTPTPRHVSTCVLLAGISSWGSTTLSLPSGAGTFTCCVCGVVVCGVEGGGVGGYDYDG